MTRDDEPSLDDVVKCALAAGRPARAVEATLLHLGPSLRAYFRAQVGDRAALADLDAELGMQLVLGLPRFRGESSVRTYAYAIAKNLVRHHWRRAHRDRALFADDDPPSEAPDAGPDAAYVRTVTQRRLAEALAKLDDGERHLVGLRVDRSLSWAEIAGAIGSGTTGPDLARLRKRYERLVARLRRDLDDAPAIVPAMRGRA